MKSFFLSIILIVFILSGAQAGSEYYHYTDDQGIKHFTENYGDVPQKYRSQVQTNKAIDTPVSVEQKKPEPISVKALAEEKKTLDKKYQSIFEKKQTLESQKKTLKPAEYNRQAAELSKEIQAYEKNSKEYNLKVKQYHLQQAAAIVPTQNQ
jgi:hypothetical protein